MSENEEKSKFLTKISCLLFFMLYLGLSIYSAVTAGQNIPNDNTNKLFLACYIITIVQCILYFICAFVVPFLIVEDKTKDIYYYLSVFLIDIFWMVIWQNNDVLGYNTYALVHSIIFIICLSILGLLILLLIIILRLFFYNGKTKSTVKVENVKNEITV